MKKHIKQLNNIHKKLSKRIDCYKKTMEEILDKIKIIKSGSHKKLRYFEKFSRFLKQSEIIIDQLEYIEKVLENKSIKIDEIKDILENIKKDNKYLLMTF